MSVEWIVYYEQYNRGSDVPQYCETFVFAKDRIEAEDVFLANHKSVDVISIEREDM